MSRLPVIGALLLVLSPLGAGAIEPFLTVEAEFGVLKLVYLDTFDPPPPGPEIPPPIAYADEVSTRPLAVENPLLVAEDLTLRAATALADLQLEGLVRPDVSDLADLSAREFTLTIVWLTRASLDVPLTSPGIDDHSFEQLMRDRRGVCRHLARFAETAFALLQPLCPAARDLRMVEFGDGFTHSWLRVVAIEPAARGWSVTEIHIDLAAPGGGTPLIGLDMARATDVWFPLRAMALDRAGLDGRAADAWWAYIADPRAPRRASASVTLLAALRDRQAWDRMAPVADEATRVLTEDQEAMRERCTGITPEQHLQVRQTLYEILADVPPDRFDGLPTPRQRTDRIAQDQALRESLVSFIGRLEDDLADGRRRAARERLAGVEDGADGWAYRAVYADALRRAAIAARRAGEEGPAIDLTAERYRILPGDLEAGDQLANSMLNQVQRLRAGETVDIGPLLRHADLLPAGVPETHLVRAELARLDGDPSSVGAEFEAVVRACDEQRAATTREQLFRLHAMVELTHLARARGDDDAVIAWTISALPRLREAASQRDLEPRQLDDLTICWWDIGITLTIADCDPELALQVWEAFVDWAPDEPRALYGRARGRVQLARAQLERATTAHERQQAVVTSRQALDALGHVAGLQVPVPNSETYMQLAWFNLSTALENAGLPWEALEVADAAMNALPQYPLGSVLKARTLGMLCSGPEDVLGEATVGELGAEAAKLLTELPADLPDHLAQSAAMAYHHLAVGAANHGDRAGARGIVDAGLERFPGEEHLEELREQLVGR